MVPRHYEFLACKKDVELNENSPIALSVLSTCPLAQ